MYDMVWVRVSQWTEGNYIRTGIPLGLWDCSHVCLQKLFCGFRLFCFDMFNNNFQETLLIPMHAFSMGDQYAIRNEGFHHYLSGSEDKCQENRRDGMPSIPGVRGTGRQNLHLDDDRGGD